MEDTIHRKTCAACGHVWFPRKPETPAKCPSCQSFQWERRAAPTETAEAVSHVSELAKHQEGATER